MSIKRTTLLLPVLLLTAILFAQTDPGTQNLRHSWTFDDGTANDTVGNADGTLMGGAVIEDGALVTAELDQYLELLAEDVELQTYPSFTIEMLYQSFPDMNTSYHMFFYFGDTTDDLGNNGFFMTPARGDNLSRAAISCWISPPYQGENYADGPEYDDGTRHLMVATLTNEEIALYMDGVETGRSELEDHNTIDGLIPNYCYLAKSGYNGDATWRGMIFECNIYDRVLTDDEILFLARKNNVAAVDRQRMPGDFALLRNYPNPFNPSTTISFSVPVKSRVTLTVCDMLGHQVAELLDEVKEAGQFSVQFDGSHLASGLYLCRMQTDGREIFTSKMMLLK